MSFPTKYDPSYCDLIVKEMAEGKSMTAFAGETGVARSTLQKWAQAHPEFKEAVQRGKEACSAWWESKGRDTAETNKGNSTMVIFGLKNMAKTEWQDKQQIEQSGTVEIKQQIDLSKLSAEELRVLGGIVGVK